MDHVLRCHEIVKTDMVQAQGCYLYDVQGRRYVDFEAGVWCTALGHNHWRVNQIVRNQMDQVLHIGYRYTNHTVEEAAAEVLRTVRLSRGKCTFLSSGSEAVEFGVQVARRVTAKPLLLTLSDSYLSAYGSAGGKSPKEWYCFDWGACAICTRSKECDPQCDRLREIPFRKIGGIVFEPGNAYGLVKLPPRQLIQALVRLVKQQDGLLVVDEVTTGLGRTGTWYGFEHYDLQPDIIVMGKGLGNGYPVSAVAMNRDTADRLESSAFRYAQSHQNDPLGCAVAKEVLTVIREDGLVARSDRVGRYFLGELRRLGARYDVVEEVRGRGLMIGVAFKRNDENFSATSLYLELLNGGFLVGCNSQANLVRFYPPLTIDEAHIAELVEHLDRTLQSIR